MTNFTEITPRNFIQSLMAQWGSLSPIFITQSPSRPSSRSAPSQPLSFTDSDFWPTDSPYASNDDHLPFGYIDLTAEPPSPSPPSAAPMAHRQTSLAVQELLQTSDEPHTAKRRRLNNGDSESVILADASPVQKIEEVDLRDVDDDRDLSKLLEQQRADTIRTQQEQSNKPVRLSTLQCVVCMENMTNMTATHCGHLFCHTCLMEALIAGENQGYDGKRSSKCPICRKKVARTKGGKDPRQVIPLELKLKTRTARAKEKEKVSYSGNTDTVEVT